MSDKAPKKKPEITQPRPDIVLPDDNGAADYSDRAVLHSPSPRSEVYQQTLQSRCPDQEES